MFESVCRNEWCIKSFLLCMFKRCTFWKGIRHHGYIVTVTRWKNDKERNMKKYTCNKIRSKAKVTCWSHGWSSGWLNYDSCSLLLATDNADGSNNDAQKYETDDSSHHCPNDCSNGSVGEIRVNKLSFLNLKWRIQFICLLHFLRFACL